MFDITCRCHGGCPYCISSRMYRINKAHASADDQMKETAVTKLGLAEIVVILDRSGSMWSTKGDAEGGLREFVSKQRLLPGDCRLTFYRFDDQIERVFEDRPLKEVRDEDLKLEPRGGTALMDAMAQAIDEVGDRLARRADYDRPEHVYVVTVTDGHENASRRTSKQALFDRIARQRDKYKWEFIYIGANQDAIATAASFGIDATHSLSYNASRIGTLNAYDALTRTVALSRKGGQAVSFSLEDRKSAMEE